jgi:type III secretory pathway component EscU
MEIINTYWETFLELLHNSGVMSFYYALMICVLFLFGYIGWMTNKKNNELNNQKEFFSAKNVWEIVKTFIWYSLIYWFVITSVYVFDLQKIFS